MPPPDSPGSQTVTRNTSDMPSLLPAAPPPTFNKASPTDEKLSHSGRDSKPSSTYTRTTPHVTSNHPSHSQDTQHPSAISLPPSPQHFTSTPTAHHKTSDAPTRPHQHPSLLAHGIAPTRRGREHTEEHNLRREVKEEGKRTKHPQRGMSVERRAESTPTRRPESHV